MDKEKPIKIEELKKEVIERMIKAFGPDENLLEEKYSFNGWEQKKIAEVLDIDEAQISRVLKKPGFKADKPLGIIALSTINKHLKLYLKIKAAGEEAELLRKKEEQHQSKIKNHESEILFLKENIKAKSVRYQKNIRKFWGLLGILLGILFSIVSFMEYRLVTKNRLENSQVNAVRIWHGEHLNYRIAIEGLLFNVNWRTGIYEKADSTRHLEALKGSMLSHIERGRDIIELIYLITPDGENIVEELKIFSLPNADTEIETDADKTFKELIPILTDTILTYEKVVAGIIGKSRDAQRNSLKNKSKTD